MQGVHLQRAPPTQCNLASNLIKLSKRQYYQEGVASFEDDHSDDCTSRGAIAHQWARSYQFGRALP